MRAFCNTHGGFHMEKTAPSAVKNTGIILVSCRATRKCVLTAVFGNVDIPEVPEYHLLRQMQFSVKVTKITSRIGFSLTHSLPFWFLHLLWLNQSHKKVHKLDNFESYNFLKLSCTNVPGRRSNFLGCECFFGSNSPDMLALCETNLDGWIASTYFSFTIFFSLIWMDSRSHMHGLSIYVKERLPFCMKLVL